MGGPYLATIRTRVRIPQKGRGVSKVGSTKQMVKYLIWQISGFRPFTDD